MRRSRLVGVADCVLREAIKNARCVRLSSGACCFPHSIWRHLRYLGYGDSIQHDAADHGVTKREDRG
jgi:hypothetical protein